ALFQQRRGLKRGLEVFTYSNYAQIKIIYSQTVKHRFFCRIAYARCSNVRGDLANFFLVDIHRHDMIPEIGELLGKEFTEFSHSDYKYGFHFVSLYAHCALPDRLPAMRRSSDSDAFHR